MSLFGLNNWPPIICSQKQKFTFCFYERVNFAGELFDHEDLDLECFVFSSFFKDFLFDPMIPEN